MRALVADHRTAVLSRGPAALAWSANSSLFFLLRALEQVFLPFFFVSVVCHSGGSFVSPTRRHERLQTRCRLERFGAVFPRPRPSLSPLLFFVWRDSYACLVVRFSAFLLSQPVGGSALPGKKGNGVFFFVSLANGYIILLRLLIFGGFCGFVG